MAYTQIAKGIGAVKLMLRMELGEGDEGGDSWFLGELPSEMLKDK